MKSSLGKAGEGRKWREVLGKGGFLLLLFLSTRSFAWTEPDNFRGLKFGDSLTKQIPECPYDLSPSKSYRSSQSKEPCWQDTVLNQYLKGDPAKIYYVISNVGRLGDVAMTVDAVELHGKLARVELTFNSGDFHKLLAIFKEAYGSPTSTDIKQWRSKAGASFTNFTATWIGGKITIHVEERGSKVDRGFASYATESWLTAASQKTKDAIKRGAEQLKNPKTITEESSLKIDTCNNSNSCYELALKLLDGGEDTAAVEAYKKAIQFRPDFAIAHYKLGLLYAKRGQRSSAMEHYRILRDLDAKLADALISMIPR